MLREHVGLGVLVDFFDGDRRVGQVPDRAWDFFSAEELHGRDDRGAPLVGRVGGRDRRQVLLLPLGEEVLLVLAGDDWHLDPGILERLDRRDRGCAGIHPDRVERAFALEIVLDDGLGLSAVVVGELEADDLDLGVGREDPLGGADQRVSSTSTPGRMRSASTLPPSGSLSTMKFAAPEAR